MTPSSSVHTKHPAPGFQPCPQRKEQVSLEKRLLLGLGTLLRCQKVKACSKRKGKPHREGHVTKEPRSQLTEFPMATAGTT